MIEAIKNVIKQINSGSKETREEAILQVAMILEKHSPLADKPSFYESILHPSLLNVSLDETEMQEIIEYLSNLIKSDKMVPAMIWALSKSLSLSALKTLLTLIGNEKYRLDEGIEWQILVGIDNFLSIKKGTQLHDGVFNLIDKTNLLLSLDKVTNDGSPRIKELAQNMINKMNKSIQ